MEGRKMTRSRNERLVGGVAGGLAAYLNIDPLVIRLVFIILALFQGVGLFIYLVLWLLTPIEGSLAPDARSQVSENFGDMQETTQRLALQARDALQSLFRS